MPCPSCNPANEADIHIRVGESKTYEFVVRDSTKALVDLTLAKIYFSVKRRTEDPTYVFQRLSVQAGGDAAQVEILNQLVPATLGRFRVYLVPNNTNGLDPSTTYRYDTWTVPANGRSYILRPPTPFIVEPTVTVFAPT